MYPRLLALKNGPIVLAFLATICGCSTEEFLIDVDGNQYPIKQFGNTLWTTENLKVIRDNNTKKLKYYIPNDDTATVSSYGLLYTYEEACKACPEGWQLPNNEDWQKLLSVNSGTDAKTYKDVNFWLDEINTNTSHFSARPAGIGNSGEYPNHFGDKTLFWSDTKEDEHFVWAYIMERGSDSVRWADQHPTYAFSVRCIKRLAQ